MQPPAWMHRVALVATLLVAGGFLVAHFVERASPCTPEVGCLDERLALPIAGFIAALMALASLALALRLRRRTSPRQFALPCALAALVAYVVVRVQIDEWILPLWWPLLVVALADAALLLATPRGA